MMNTMQKLHEHNAKITLHHVSDFNLSFYFFFYLFDQGEALFVTNLKKWRLQLAIIPTNL